eukprot:gnl/Dysnectes_brevis/10445_a20688_137.p1 GENE.gnl/Dysnectes_brevis/10445_a20688_137~~gnl/Dysnectes_brevis/10445_a20688_137.p1  ORF type:complete len:440 (+),score=121.92 gnl/Dysnectes_brevis/10445_a20688_137:240-1559(+)
MSWVLGITISLGASVFLNLGVNVQKLAHTKIQASTPLSNKPYFLNPLWLMGISIFVVGNVGDFVALGLASPTILTPLGCVSLISNGLFAVWLLSEVYTKYDAVATVLMCTGAIIAVIFGSHSSTTFTLDELLDAFVTIPFILFLIGTSAIFAAGMTYARFRTVRIQQDRSRARQYHMRMEQARKDMEQARIDSRTSALVESAKPLSPWPSFPPLEEERGGVTVSSVLGSVSDSLPSGLDVTLPPPSSVPASVSYSEYNTPSTKATLLGLVMSALPGPVGALTVISSKAASELVISTVQGDNQMDQFGTWALIGTVVVTALGQVLLINWALQYHQALLVVPIQYVSWTVFTLVATGVYYKDFTDWSVWRWLIFLSGIATVFAGVRILLMKSNLVDGVAVSPDKEAKSPMHDVITVDSACAIGKGIGESPAGIEDLQGIQV